MDDDNVGMVRRAYEAFNRGDMATVLDSLDPSIEWVEPEVPAPYPVSGRFAGRDAVVAGVFGTVPTHWQRFRHELDRIIDAGDTVVVLGRLDGAAIDGRTTDAAFAHVLDVRDGRIARFENHPDTLALFHAQGGDR